MNKTSSFVSYSSYFIENEKFKQDISLSSKNQALIHIENT